MATELLDSQLTRPSMPRRMVHRPRVSLLLDETLTVPVTLVTGAAGSGKTTALLEWTEGQDEVDAGGPRMAWTSLERIDDDLELFWRCVLASVDTAIPGCAERPLALLDREGPSGAIVAALLAELDGGDVPLVVILDDLHLISDPHLLPQLVQLVDRLPRSVHVVASSRVDLGLPVARWAVRDEVRQIREDDLSFTPDEGADFLSQFVAGLDADAVKIVLAQTEGWAAGLQLAALSFEGRPDAGDFARSRNPNDRVTADFLLDEVLHRQPPEIQEFLLSASLLEPVTAELCDAITGRSDSADVLADLEARHLFLSRVEDQPGTFRFHRLFGELLRRQLVARSPGRARQLHLIAAHHQQQHHQLLAAAHHFIAADDLDAAWAVIAGAVQAAGDGASRRRLPDDAWSDLVPIDHFAEQDGRMVEYANALTIAGRYEPAAQVLLTLQDRSVAPEPDELSNAEMVWNAHQGFLQPARQQAGEAVARTGDPLRAADRARVLVHAARIRAISGDLTGAQTAIELIQDSGSGSGHLVTVAMPSVASLVAWMAGDLVDAERLSNRAQGAELVNGGDPKATATEAWLVGRALAIERDELDESGMDELIDLASSDREFLPISVLGWLLSIEWARTQFRFDLGLDLLEQARQCLDRRDRGRGYQPHLDYCEATLQLDRGDIEGARRVRHRLSGGWVREVVDIRLDLASQRRSSGRARIANLRPDTRRRRMEACLLAVRAEGPVDDRRARAKLGEALQLGESQGFLRTYLDAGPDVMRLLRSMDHLEPTLQLQRILARNAGPGPTPEPGGWLVEGLSDRESTVLRLLPSSLSNRELADELFISLNTLKTHLKGVYRKLDVRSRQEAVDCARRVGLL